MARFLFRCGAMFLLTVFVLSFDPPVALANAPETSAGPFSGTTGAAITVTPSDNLPATQLVSVSGMGFSANSFVNISEFTTTFLGGSIGGASTDASGSFGPVMVTVTRIVGGADCVVVGCVVFVDQGEFIGIQAAHHLTFSSYPLAVDGPPPPAALTLPPPAAPSSRVHQRTSPLPLVAVALAVLAGNMAVAGWIRHRRPA